MKTARLFTAATDAVSYINNSLSFHSDPPAPKIRPRRISLQTVTDNFSAILSKPPAAA